MRSLVLTMAALLASTLSGCQGEVPTAGDNAAEVPTAGASTTPVESGPAPEGQSEPEPAAEGTSGSTEATQPAAGTSGGDPAPVVDPAAEGSAAEGSSACDPEAPAADEAEEETPEVTLQVGAWSDVEALIALHKGKVVVVDLWSTSCIPCRKEFPNLVKIHEELGDQVACISVSTDYSGIPSKPVESYRDKVTTFLTQQSATFDNVLLNQSSEEVFLSLDLGSIPAVYVYDAEGKLVQRFADPEDGEEFTYAEDIRPVVEKLLPAAE
jgi:thiol-disulfide isomerase/thioredoxin